MDQVIDNADAGAFELIVDGHRAFADYVLQGNVMILPHTVVPPEIGGRGIAARLVAAALDSARARGLRVEPKCSYVAAYMERHPETHDLLVSASG